MAKFQVGQEIVCVNSKSTRNYLKLNKIYKVLSVKYCINCGAQSICAAEFVSQHNHGIMCCAFCHTHTQNIKEGSSIYFGSYRFVALEEMICTSEEIEELLNSSVMAK